jgi:two-component system sensor histidine kinase PilS (NtrC family)
MHSKGLLESPLGGQASDTWFVKLYLDVSIFFLVGSVSGYLAERMKSRGKQLATAESQLKQLKVDTDKILENMSSGILVVDSKGKILTLNPAAGEILGFTREDLLFKRLEESIATVMPELSAELEYALSSEENKQRHEIVIKNKRGEQIPLGISISLLRDGGRKRGVIAVFQNLTEVREMQERIRKADRLAAIGELSAGIAHEIRNPLASISGSIEILHNELNLNEEQKRLMKLIMRESDRLNNIITDFLEFARMRPPAKREADIDKCLKDVLVLMGNNANFGCGISIELDQQAVGGLVRIDEEQVRQVFLNLCINACESMEGHGKLRIETRFTDDNQLSIVFQDNGSGIEVDNLDHLFEPFFTTKDGGTGLGLAIANKIIEAHGGRIIYQNREPGGAEFRVMLPAMETTESDYECSSQVTAKCTS